MTEELQPETKQPNHCRLMVFAILLTMCLAFVFLYRTDLNLSTTLRSYARQSSVDVTSSPSEFFEFTFDGYNRTHLWSMRLADHYYRTLARIIPCPTVTYDGGPHHKISEDIETCFNSSKNEFSIINNLHAQKWIYDHQHPANCSEKRFAIIRNFASSGYGSIIHQVAWAFAMALAQDRVAIYQSPGNWLYGNCPLMNLDCVFLPITNCSMPSSVDGNRTIYIDANFGYWKVPIHPPIFQKRSFTWYRAQLVFYLMRFNRDTMDYVQSMVAKNFQPPSVDHHRPYLALYVRRSDKVRFKEMSQAYSLKNYFDLFAADAQRANISTIYLNSEDPKAFEEFLQFNRQQNNPYRLLTINVTRNVVYGSLTHMPQERRSKIVMEFLADLYIEANADLHAGTLTSNWCRLVDEFRLVLGKSLPYYTPEKKYLNDWRR